MTVEEQVSSSDAELVARMAHGDRLALAALYERHAPRLCAIAEHILGERGEAEDLLHDVFLEAWRHAADYAENRGTVKSWLALRTRSRAVDRRRAAPRRRTVELGESHLEALGGEADAALDPDRASERRKLAAALRAMSPEERDVLLLGYFEGLSSSEIAQHLGIPAGTVKSRTRAALIKLRAFFASKGATR